MLQLSVTESGHSATLSAAILLYGDNRTTYATVHEVKPIKDRPEIMPGRLVTEADLVALAKDLSSGAEAIATHWIDPGVLAKGQDRLIWWTPPGKRPMFFQASGRNNDTFTGSAVCPVPGLVWMAMPGHGLYVYAIKGALRPDQQTQLYQAPFFNVWGRGRVCIGSAFLPTEEKKWSSEAWEQTFFGSRFTHPNFSEKNRLIQGASPTKFWKGMVGKPAEAFPEQKLVQMPLMVADLLDRMLLDTLAKLPKPKGEF